ncbi:hypothetical protein [Actinacidiphila sp. ITFR-21]|uniref:hypothetical protein n=1 Tax=Actinacidiphila sp. ITFR-21 TaxID=3075199 RepID=UPI00288A77D4|nr:hypothetical protein [Streptomyces sp. ITFR-21]WNI19225.1 hypothetical protein RLT57_29220 [Streptomyces sp. ITFR-21]
MTALDRVIRDMGEPIACEVVAEAREETLRLAAAYLRAKYGPTNRAAGDLIRLAELETQGKSALEATP